MRAIQGLILAALTAAFVCPSASAAPDDPYLSSEGSWQQDFADQWAVVDQRIYADIAQEPPGEQIIVAVIDTGLDYAHEDFASEKLWHNPRERKNNRDDDNNGFVDDLIGWNFVDHSNNPFDQSGHGTHIAGIIGACTDNGLGIAAVSPNAKIMPLKVANFVGQARSSSVSAAIYYAVDHGARIINLSLGGELVTELERDAARYAAERDVLIVVSAGNRGLDAGQQGGYPTLPDVLVVGATDTKGARAGFSNFGSALAVVAPGVDILSLRAADTDFIALSDPLDYPQGGAFVGEEDSYYRASGTSFSAAFVSGIAARLLGQRPHLNREELARLITQSAADIEQPGVDQTSGFGLVNYLAAAEADADRFVDAELARADLELKEASLVVNIFGTADSSDFTGADLLIRAAAGSVPPPPVVEEEPRKRRKSSRRRKKEEEEAPPPPSPYDWKSLGPLNQPVQGALLASFDVEEMTKSMQGSNSWELMLTVASGDGSLREAFMALEFPQPEPQPEEETSDE